MDEGYSHSKKHSVIYKWKINEITSFVEAARNSEDCISINSPNFSTGAKIKDSWSIELKIDKDNNKLSRRKSWLSVHLCPHNGDRQVRTQYSLFLVTNKNEKRCLSFDVSKVWINHFFVGSSCGYNQFVRINQLFEKKIEFLKNDTLTLGVELIVYDDYTLIDNTLKPLKSLKRKMNDDFRELLVAKKKCDVNITVGDKTFQAHKTILAARSSMFDAMFSHDMKENRENAITIPDVDPNVFEKILEFIYTDRVNELGSDVEELLEASDKYQLQALKGMCEDYLSKTISIKTAIRTLLLSDHYNAKRLMNFSMQFIVINFTELKDTGECDALEQSHPSLFVNILKKYATQNKV